MVRKIFLSLLSICSFLALSACLNVQDKFDGTSLYCYLQNNSSMNLYYELLGDKQNIISTGQVDIGKTGYLKRTEQYELSGPPFTLIRVYDNSRKGVVLFEDDMYQTKAEFWVINNDDIKKYSQTLILDDSVLMSEL